MDNKTIEDLNKKINADNEFSIDFSKYYQPGISFEDLSKLILNEDEEYKLKDLKKLLEYYQEQKQIENDNKVIR
jgi:hypothetical protein